MRRTISALFLALLLATAASGQTLETIKLPAPQKSGGMPLLDALASRQTQRAFTPRDLPRETLSTLLWAAFGINRPDGKRTAPSASNMQEIDIYVVKAEGAYRYDATANTLEPVAAGDHRAATGGQPFVSIAPMNLVYVADYARMGKSDAAAKDFYSATDTGFIAQNVYLYCAANSLACVVRGGFDNEAIAKALKLRPDQKVMLKQTVGFPE